MTTLEPFSPPPPHSLKTHLTYSLAAFHWMREARRALQAADDAIRAAVGTRDETLARLGESTLSAVDDDAPDRLRAFASTLTSLEATHEQAVKARADLEIGLATAEDERREELADFDGRVDAAKAELAPIERAMETLRRTLDELSTLDADEARARRALRAELSAPEPEETSQAIKAKLATLETAAHERAKTIDAHRTERDEVQRTLSAAESRLQELRTAGRMARVAADARLDELRLDLNDAGDRITDIAARRQAALVDLGREVLEMEPGVAPEGPRSEASGALAQIVTLRREREALLRARGAVRLAPVARTAIATLALGLVGMLTLVLIW